MERLGRILWQSVKAARAFKLRTVFCILSVALGISSITIIVAATEGAYKKAFEMVALFGPDSLLVIGGSDEARAIGQREKTITLEDVRAVRESFPSAYIVVPMTAIADTTITYQNKKYQTLVVGSTADYGRAWTWPVIEGSDITEEDVKGLRNVALLGLHVVKELFGAGDPVGKYILVRGIPVQVVGVLSERGTTPTGQIIDNRIVMPLSTVMAKMQNEKKYIAVFRARFSDQSMLSVYESELRLFLRQRHGIPENQPDDFKIISPKEIIKFLVALTGSLVAFLGIVGIISLVVAGFVLANLFLLSVKERTAEIGIRRSVGAKRSDIRFQFLAEAVILTTAGGALGYGAARAAAGLLTLVAAFPIDFSWKAFAVGLILSWVVGIAFGLQPASRAANIEPIEAIRT